MVLDIVETSLKFVVVAAVIDKLFRWRPKKFVFILKMRLSTSE